MTIEIRNGQWLLNGQKYTEVYGSKKQIFEDYLRSKKIEYAEKMTEEEQRKFWNEQLRLAKDSKSISAQQYKVAERIESEATAALERLGVSPEQPRKGKLSEERKLQMMAGLTGQA